MGSHLLFRFPFMRSLSGWPGTQWLLLFAQVKPWVLIQWPPRQSRISSSLSSARWCGTGPLGATPRLEVSPDQLYRNWQLKVVQLLSTGLLSLIAEKGINCEYFSDGNVCDSSDTELVKFHRQPLAAAADKLTALVSFSRGKVVNVNSTLTTDIFVYLPRLWLKSSYR